MSRFKRRKNIRRDGDNGKCPVEFLEILKMVKRMPEQHWNDFEYHATNFGWDTGDGELWLSMHDVDPENAVEMKDFLSTITEKHNPHEALCYVLAAVCVIANKNKLIFKVPKNQLWDFTRKMLKRAAVRNELADA